MGQDGHGGRKWAEPKAVMLFMKGAHTSPLLPGRREADAKTSLQVGETSCVVQGQGSLGWLREDRVQNRVGGGEAHQPASLSPPRLAHLESEDGSGRRVKMPHSAPSQPHPNPHPAAPRLHNPEPQATGQGENQPPGNPWGSLPQTEP